MNIVLIGLPTSGKSTVGVVLARYLGMGFTDTDLVIQSAWGQRLSGIIAAQGPGGFLRAEEKVLTELEADNTVIATGGSVVYSDRAMAHLKRNAVTVPFHGLRRMRVTSISRHATLSGSVKQ